MQKKLFSNVTQIKPLSAQTMRIVFIVVLAMLIAVFFLQAFVTNGVQTTPIFFQDTNDTFMDFLKVQKSITELSPVSEGIYPPLSYIFLLPFNSFVDYSQTDPFTARGLQMGIMSIVIYFLIWLFIGAVFLSKIISKYRRQSIIIVFLLFLSAPMIFLLERGNLNLTVLALLAIFFAYYESKSPLLREIAIIALAIATGVKLYPALFGLLLFKKSTISSFFRLAGYCVASIILPVFFFDGGLENIRHMAGNILNFSNTLSNWPDSPALRSILGFGAMFRATSIELGIGQGYYQLASQITSYVMLAGSIIGSFFVDKTWKKAALLACPIVLFPAMSGIYNLVYFFIPIMLFLKEEEHKWIDYLYLFLFLIMLNPVQIGFWIPMVARTTIISNISAITLNSLLCLEGLMGVIKFVKQRVRSKAIHAESIPQEKLKESDISDDAVEEISE